MWRCAAQLLPDKANEILETLSPAGRVDRLALTVEALDQPLHRWELAATVTDATTDPFRKVPGLVGIDASISANEEGATAWIDTQDFALVLSNVYREPIRLTSVLGTLEGRWQQDALFLEHGLLLGSAPEHDAAVQFEMDIPFQNSHRCHLRCGWRPRCWMHLWAFAMLMCHTECRRLPICGCNRHCQLDRLKAGFSCGTAGSNPTATPVKPCSWRPISPG